MGTVFFHIDLDAFFASVEIRDNPSLKDIPLIIGGTGPRSVVSTCSYEARKYGVHSAMSSGEALRLCPKAIVISPNMKKYKTESNRVMGILKTFSPTFRQMSIDEASLEMTGTEKLFGPPKKVAIMIQTQIMKQTGLSVSIGIARSRFIAKMASDYKKPHGITLISPGHEQDFVDAIGLEKIWGIGKKSIERLYQHNIKTVPEVREKSLEYLQQDFSPVFGKYLYSACRGQDPGIYNEHHKSQSISTETTFTTDATDSQTLEKVLLSMSRKLSLRCIKNQVIASTIGLKLRWGSNFKTITVQTTPEEPILNTDQIFQITKKLLHEKWKEPEGIRLIGIILGNIYKGAVPVQSTLFMEKETKKRKLDKTAQNLSSQGFLLVKAGEIQKNHSTKTDPINSENRETVISDIIDKEP